MVCLRLKSVLVGKIAETIVLLKITVLMWYTNVMFLFSHRNDDNSINHLCVSCLMESVKDLLSLYPFFFSVHQKLEDHIMLYLQSRTLITVCLYFQQEKELTTKGLFSPLVKSQSQRGRQLKSDYS